MIITLIDVKKADDVCVANVAVEEGGERRQGRRSSGSIRVTSDSDSESPVLKPLDDTFL